MRYAMIMAGGAGTRLWPMSRKDRPKQLLRFITRPGDAKALTKLPEIGKRMAETIIAELSGKVDTFLSTAEVKQLGATANGQAAVEDPIAEEAIMALVALGETRTDAQAMVARAQAKARHAGRELTTASGVLEAVFGR